jgi:hypothetical protein
LPVLYLLLIVFIATLAYIAMRVIRANARADGHRPTRVIGPDDDPEFLWRLSHGDNNPR